MARPGFTGCRCRERLKVQTIGLRSGRLPVGATRGWCQQRMAWLTARPQFKWNLMQDPQPTAKAIPLEESRPGSFRFSMTQFLVALVLLIVTYPFVIGLQSGEFIEDLLLMVLFVSAALAIGGGRWPLTILLITPAIVCAGISQYRQGLIPTWVINATHSIFVAFVVLQLYRFVRGATRVTTEVMNAGIAGYLMLGILWTPTRKR